MTDKNKSKQQAITQEFLDILKKEGDKATESCIKLNADNTFSKTVNKLTNPEFKNIAYKSEHTLMYDLVKVYTIFSGLYTKDAIVPIRVNFILIYYYEKLKGNDLLKTYTLAKITALTQTKLFEKNVNTVRATSFFQPLSTIKDEFITTTSLQHIKNPEFENIASFLNRIALLIARTDLVVSNNEQDILQKITTKINEPKTPLKSIGHSSIPENDTLEIVLKELNELVGLQNIKQNITDLTNFLKVQKLRKKEGLKIANNSLHAVFMGPPGTGKTTVARLLGRIYKHLGYLEKGHLVETDRAGLVAGYVGQTAIKTAEIITESIGGVLFIDEAYALTSSGMNDFGSEAIETLLKKMEDHRNELVIIVAGYPDEMQTFVQSNPGLQSRFNRYFEFSHFDSESLLDIFQLYVKKGDFELTVDAVDKLTEIIHRIHEKRGDTFGNARTMRNLFEKIIERQANRIVTLKKIDKKILITLTEEDIPEILKTVKEILVFDED